MSCMSLFYFRYNLSAIYSDPGSHQGFLHVSQFLAEMIGHDACGFVMHLSFTVHGNDRFQHSRRHTSSKLLKRENQIALSAMSLIFSPRNPSGIIIAQPCTIKIPPGDRPPYKSMHCSILRCKKKFPFEAKANKCLKMPWPASAKSFWIIPSFMELYSLWDSNWTSWNELGELGACNSAACIVMCKKRAPRKYWPHHWIDRNFNKHLFWQVNLVLPQNMGIFISSELNWVSCC